MDILLVLQNFENLSESDKAWVMTTLLDFADQHFTEFEKRYGTYARGVIKTMRGEV